MLTIITREEFAIELPSPARVTASGYDVFDHVVEMGQVFIAQSAQSIRDLFWISDFGADKPESVNKRKSDEFLPLFTEVPENEFISILLPETEGLIADE